MCLDEIRNTRPRTTGVGYKIFNVNTRGDLVGHIWGRENKPRVIGEWIRAEDYAWSHELHRKDINYIPYWHLFKTHDEAVAYSLLGAVQAIRKVKYRKATTAGVQIGLRVVVAKEIYILEE